MSEGALTGNFSKAFLLLMISLISLSMARTFAASKCEIPASGAACLRQHNPEPTSALFASVSAHFHPLDRSASRNHFDSHSDEQES